MPSLQLIEDQNYRHIQIAPLPDFDTGECPAFEPPGPLTFDSMNTTDRIIRQSPFSVKETIDRLASLLEQKGITIYARIDQQAEAARSGITLNALEFLLFGNPQRGGQVMAENPAAALDLPLKVLAWEDEQHISWVTYNEADYIRQRYSLSEVTARLLDVDPLITALLKA